MEFLTFWKIPGMSRTLPTGTDIRAMRSSTEVTDVSYTSVTLMWPQKKKSIHARNLAGQCIGPPQPIHRCPKVTSNCRRTSFVIFGGAPSWWYHMQWRNDGGTCAESSSSSRTCCKKIRYALPSKRLCRKYGPMT